MSHIRLRYPVHTLDNELLLPAGTVLSPETMTSLVFDSRRQSFPDYNLLSYGSVKNDVFDFIHQMPSYHVIFSDKKKLEMLSEIMEYVHLPLPVLESLDYFKQNDTDTYRHILMVFALSTLLALEIIPGNCYQLIQEASAGPTHDFGKICVPLEILKKKTALTPDEWDILKHHTLAGYVLLSYYFKDAQNFAARVARDHHEKRNGSGYPAGICLKDRMIEIVAVSDIYDALISPRPYRPVSYDNRTALEEITVMAERGEITREVVKALVANNRKDRPHYKNCKLSHQKRGKPPRNNLYGILSDG